jgi:hypothetical protein
LEKPPQLKLSQQWSHPVEPKIWQQDQQAHFAEYVTLICVVDIKVFKKTIPSVLVDHEYAAVLNIRETEPEGSSDWDSNLMENIVSLLPRMAPCVVKRSIIEAL